MTDLATLDAYGVLTEPSTLTIKRRLPGPAERIWAYLTDGDLRRKWLASGAMGTQAGDAFTMTWRNDELMAQPGRRPEGFSAEHSMESRIIEIDPPRRLAFTFGQSGEVTFDLEPDGKDVLLTLVHRRLPDRAMLLKVAAGWHAHLDVLAARAAGQEPGFPFWDHWASLKDDYARRIPA
jgi:uncharacterized protein YndB with AHSA1/START domain